MTSSEWLLNKSDGIIRYIKIHPEILIFCSVTFFVAIGFWFQKNLNNNVAIRIQENYNNADSIISKRLAEGKKLDSISLCKNLKTIYYYIDNHKKAKIELAKIYQGFVVTCFSLGVFFVGLGGITGFVVTKTGWDHSSRSRKALLLSFAFYGIVLSTFPKLFNQEENYKLNFVDYTAFSRAQIYIFFKLSPYIAKQGNILSSKDSMVLNSAIDTVNEVLLQHSNINMNFDEKQLENIKTYELK